MHTPVMIATLPPLHTSHDNFLHHAHTSHDNCSSLHPTHTHQSLIVLEYLIKSGSERVAQQCKENLFSIQTLKDFQYVDKDGKDQGANSELK